MGCAASPCFSFIAARAESGTGPMGQSEATPLDEEVDKPAVTSLNDKQALAESGEGEATGVIGMSTSDVQACAAEPDGMLLTGLEAALEPEVQEEGHSESADLAASAEHSYIAMLTGSEAIVEPAASVAPKLLQSEQPPRLVDLAENAVANIADVSSSTLAAVAQSEEEKQAAEEENQRVAAEKIQADKVAAKKVEEQRMAAERAKAEREAAEAIAAEKALAEKAAAEKAAAEKAAAEKAAAEKEAAEKAEAERTAAAKAEAERVEAAKADAEKAEEERVRAEKAEAEREAAEKAAAEKVLVEQRAAEKAEAERTAAAHAEAERAEAERAEAERAEVERAEAAKAAAEKAEEERVRAEKIHAERKAAEQAALERAAARKAVEEKQAADEAEAEKSAKASAETKAAERAALEERLAAQKAQGELPVAAAERDKVETERIATAKAATAKAATEKVEISRASVRDLSASSQSPMPLPNPMAAGVEDDDIDLARLCSAFSSLEQSRSSIGTPSFSSSAQPRADEMQTPHWSLPGAPYSGTASCSSPLRAHSDDVATPHWSLPGAPYAGHGLSALHSGVGNSSSSQAPTTPPIASATSSRAMSDSTTPMLERGASGGSTLNSLGNWSQSPSGSTAHTVTTPSKRGGAITPVDFSGQSEVVAGRMRDAQRMDAWFQRSLTKRVSAGALSPTMQRAMPATPTAATAMEGPPLQNPLDMEKENPTGNATFNLEVQLSGDVLGTLNFCHNDSINAVCESFVTEKRLRPIFLTPLVAHAELMLHMDKRADSVDAVDLI